MSSSDERVQPRREFLERVAASAIVLASGACAAPGAVSAQILPSAAGRGPALALASPHPAASTGWDDSWTTRLTARHKAVFDSPEIEDGLALFNASGYISAMREVLAAGETDVQAVIVLRHAAVPMAFNDAMWAKYEIGKHKRVRDQRTGEWARRNPFVEGSDGGGPSQASDRPSSTLAWLGTHGHILLGCDLAARNYANAIGRERSVDPQEAYRDFTSNLVPGLILQPTGVYAVLRAQEVGCAYVRAT